MSGPVASSPPLLGFLRLSVHVCKRLSATGGAERGQLCSRWHLTGQSAATSAPQSGRAQACWATPASENSWAGSRAGEEGPARH